MSSSGSYEHGKSSKGVVVGRFFKGGWSRPQEEGLTLQLVAIGGVISKQSYLCGYLSRSLL